MNEEENLPAPPSDDELPPPPVEPAEPIEQHAEPKKFDEPKAKKTKMTASLRRAFAIFGKDIRTMHKHGFISAIIVFIILAFVFSGMSYGFDRVTKMDIGGGGDGDGNGTGDNDGPQGSGVNPPQARMTISPGLSAPSGTRLTFDASDSTDNDQIVFYVWATNDGYKDVELYGKTIQFTFHAVGSHEVHLIVVDNEWNMNETFRMVNTMPSTTDNQPPVAIPGPVSDINVTESVTFDGSSSTDNVGIVDYTWLFDDGIPQILHGQSQSRTFQNAGHFEVTLIVRDAAGNINQAGFGFNVYALPGDSQPPQVDANIPSSVTVGDEVQLDASGSSDDQGISDYMWYVEYNGTIVTLTGAQTSFTADKFGPYKVTLVVRDNAGNTNRQDQTVIATPAGMELNEMSWTTQPLPTELSFNLLTYAYGIALLASVIYIGGLFTKGLKHEITKGTAKTLSLGPVSMTTMVFAKILYPLLIGPIFIFPLVFIGLMMFQPDFIDVFMIALVSYVLTALTMVSGAYGSSMIYLATKKLTVKPYTLSRLFMYLSLLGTLTVLEGVSFMLDKGMDTTSWADLSAQFSWIATLSPFHFGGVILSNMLTGTTWSIDLWVFAIPVILIAGGIFASRKIYGDIFTRE